MRAISRVLASGVALTLTFSALSLTATPAHAATIGSGDCVQTVDGLTGNAVREGNSCVVALKSGSGTWTVPAGITSIGFAVVGGGGGGGTYGGGGAGAYYEARGVAVSPGSSLSATIGAGGVAGTSTTAGGKGANSVFNGVTAYGGGGGSTLSDGAGVAGEFDPADIPVVPATDFGGSGGGAIARLKAGSVQRLDQATALAGTSNSPQGITQGFAPDPSLPASGLHRNNGGNSAEIFVFLRNGVTFTSNLSFLVAGGGGGAGAVGGDLEWTSDGTTDGTDFRPGAGGSGKSTTLLTTTTAASLSVGQSVGGSVWFAGGGGGKANFDYNPAWAGGVGGMTYDLGGAGGSGGGGVGGQAAVANSGGGGGASGAGGSGAIVIRYGIPGLPDDSGNAVSANTDSPAAVADSRIALDLRASDGRAVEGTIVEMVGSDVERGSTFALRLFEPEMLLTEGTVPPSGNLLEQFRLPGGLAPGTYTLEFSVRGPGGDTLALHRVFEVSAEGTFLGVGVNAVGLKPGVVTPEKLAYTGMSSSSLPWWAISVLVMGLLLVLYSVRARQLVDALDLGAGEPGERTPWEILSTPIQVPGIDYRAGSSGGHPGAASLNETIHELDIALSRLVVRRLDQVTHLFGRS